MTREIGLQTEGLLILFARKIVSRLDERAIRAVEKMTAMPLDQWTGFDFLEFMNRLRSQMPEVLLETIADGRPPGITRFCVEMATRCNTLGEALTISCRIYAVATDCITMTVSQQDGLASLEFKNGTGFSDPGDVLADLQLLMWHRVAEWLIGREIPLVRVEINHALDAAYTTYSSSFGTTCEFNRASGRLVFNAEFLSAGIARTVPKADDLAIEAQMSFPNGTHLQRNWKQRIRKVFRDHIAGGIPIPSLDHLAEDFCMTGQTLRRRLQAEGTTYRELKAEVRYEMAIDALTDEDKTICDASLAAGYAESSALTRALKNQAGISSTDLRNLVRQWRGNQQERQLSRAADVGGSGVLHHHSR